MRRITLESSVNEFCKLLGDPSLQKIKMMEVMSVLKYSDEEVALVCRMEFTNPTSRYEDVFSSEWGEAHLLEQEKEGTFIYFIKSKPRAGPVSFDPAPIGGYMSTPYEIKNGKVKATFLGNAKQIRELLSGVKKTGIRYKVVSLIEAKFLPSSPLNRLTAKQRKVIITAYKLGYYDLPRRINSKELAERLKIRGSTFVVHRRKAERRLLSEILREF
jgi:hypothetical protein